MLLMINLFWVEYSRDNFELNHDREALTAGG